MTLYKMTDKKSLAIKKIFTELFKLLEVKADFEIEKQDETGQEIYWLKIKTEEAGLLIGSHGQTLQSLKHFLTLMLYQKFGEWINVLVDVNDYWQKRKKELEEMARRAAERAVIDGQPVLLSYLTSTERRIIHLALASHPQAVSESEGEGRERRVVIKPRD